MTVRRKFGGPFRLVQVTEGRQATRPSCRVGAGLPRLRGHTVPGESLQSLTGESTTLKHRVQQPAREHRTLQERLEVVPAYVTDHQAEDVLAHVADDIGITTDGLPAGAGRRGRLCWARVTSRLDGAFDVSPTNVTLRRGTLSGRAPHR
ncbi:hypothetical protein ACFWNL_37785 [Kitasatospora sp. NPDC058397]|uniref:hypothetical protein n=1 Tax=unclassified Kitasatospora TaxID=2633591 RepID=UPI003666F38A